MTVQPLPGVGASRGRWLIALGVAGAAIAVTVIAVLVLGGRQIPEGLRYVPADAVVVAELRLDLPGDQLQKVGNLLAHFPGFADQSTLAQKLDEAGDRLVEALTNGTVSYTRDLKAWVSGPLYAAFRGVGTSGRLMTQPSGLFIATTNGAVGCDELFEGRTTTSDFYQGFEIRVLGSMAFSGATACVVDDRYVLAGDLESVRAGLQARARGDGLAVSERYMTARAALSGDQLATAFVAGDAFERLAELRGATPTMPALPFGASLPDWTIIGVRAEDDALVVDSVAAPLVPPSAAPSLLSVAPAHPSELTRHVPGTAIAYAEVQGAGPSLVNALTLLGTEPMFAEPIGELDQVLIGFGGIEKLLGWVDDAGVVVTSDGFEGLGDLAVGMLLLAPDEATAVARVENVRSLLALAALGGAVELETTTINGVEVTTVTLVEAAGLPADQPLQIRFAVAGRLVIIGTSEDLVGAILATDGDGSLARSEAFGRAMARGLANPSTRLYLSIESAISFGELSLPAEAASAFRTDMLPYIGPIEAIDMSATEGPDGARARIVMTVGEPGQP